MGFDNKDQLNPDVSRSLLRQGLVDAFGSVPVSDKNTTLFIRATVTGDEADRIIVGGYMFDRFGFNGNGVGLSNNQEGSLETINNTHRGWSTVEFFAFPNIRPDVIKILQAADINHREVAMETLFAQPCIPNQGQTVGQSGMMLNAEDGLLVPNIFFKGYYEKTDNSWHPNPSYWETSLEPPQRQDMRDKLVAMAMARLNEVIAQKKKEEEELFKNFKVTED